MIIKYEYDNLKITICSTWVGGYDRDWRRASVSIRDLNDKLLYSTTTFGEDIPVSKKLFGFIKYDDYRHETNDEFHERVVKESIKEYYKTNQVIKLPNNFLN